MNLQVEGWREKLNQMILGLFLIMLSSVELFGALTIMREMLEHNEKIKKFSFWFLLTNFIWDFVLFCICVKLCVERQVNRLKIRIISFILLSQQCYSGFFAFL